MANPMQRRAKNSFLLGFLLALIIMAVVVAGLIYKISKINEEKELIESKQKEVYVAAKDVESGETLGVETLRRELVQTTVNPSNVVDASTLSAVDEQTGETLIYKSKIAIPAGTIITQDMIYVDGEKTTKDQRIQEYNMIILPSQLQNGDYIDIRFEIPSGEDYIVLSKKKVEETNSDTIWIKVNEEELLVLNNAIVEAWVMDGSKLYAIQYTEPGMQEKASLTYPVSAEIYDQISNDPNVVNEAKLALAQRYNDAQVNQRVNRINSILQQYTDERDALVEAGVGKEVERRQEQREEYVTSLGGSGSEY